MKRIVLFLLMAVLILPLVAQERRTLPKPKIKGGMPLMEALSSRSSARQFSDKPLTDNQISNLLWAAFGINREDGRRTAPSAQNLQEIDLYLFTPEAVYLYDAKANELILIVEGNHMAAAGTQDYVKNGAVNVVMVTNFDKMRNGNNESNRVRTAMNAGYISQNIYLYSASDGLSTVARLMFDGKKLAELLKLPSTKQVVLTQTVGNSTK